ncbi:MAG: hypothetical protein J1D87_02400 [Lachnospiraceae bacterium]|nr:hypothetical protein [Lachnospiraceae bacterium]
MKKIMFLYHIKAREYEILNIIEKQIKEYDNNVEIKKGAIYASIFDTIQFMPDIIVSIPPRDYYGSNYLTLLKIITGAVIISMTTEGNVDNTPEMVRDMIGYNTYARELVDYYIMWGPEARNAQGKVLLNDNKLTNIKRVKVTGYVFYELDKLEEIYKKNIMYKSINEFIGSREKNILVVTGFTLADLSIRQLHMMGFFGHDATAPLNEISDYEISQAEQFIMAEKEYREKYIDIIISLAQENPNTGIIVKLHPSEINAKEKYYNSLMEYPNILLIKDAVPVGIMLKSVDCLIHYGSTCNMEAYIYKVPSIQLYDGRNFLKSSFHPKSDSTYLVHIDDRHTLIDIMNEGTAYRSLKSLEQTLYNRFNWKSDKEYRPVEKIAYYISNAKKAQRLRYGDKEVINAIKSPQGRQVINMILNDLIENIDSFSKTYSNICALIKIYIYVLFSKLIQV